MIRKEKNIIFSNFINVENVCNEQCVVTAIHKDFLKKIKVTYLEFTIEGSKLALYSIKPIC